MTVYRFNASLQKKKQEPPAYLNGESSALNEMDFQKVLARERKRSERSKRPLLLMLLESRDPDGSQGNPLGLSHLLETLTPRIRETDTIGWHQDNKTIGVIFTELSTNDKSAILNTILDKFSEAFQADPLAGQVSISFHFFPDDWSEENPDGSSNDTTLYPDVQSSINRKAFALGIKRTIDICLSFLMLAICLPLFLVIGIAVKATSRGPVFFRQQRVGQYGRHFTCLKFRSMRVNNDCSIHREYTSQLIAGNARKMVSNDNPDGVFKLANDNRVTFIGRLLRRSSLDELPQLLNVLYGDMSLVGPRPPIPYELAVYQTWHRRRLLQVKPGITGLWQVNGRNRIGFDDMVRYDLHYANTWSPWLDLKIMLLTPAAVLKGAC